MNSTKRWFVGVLTLAVLAVAHGTAANAQVPSNAAFVVSAHPDDELSVYYRIDQTNTFKVFLYLTMGDATTWCANNSAFESTEGEIFSNVGSPNSGGKYSDHCKDSRQYSTINYLNQLSIVDSTVPGGMTFASTWTGSLSAPGMSNSIPNNNKGQVTGKNARQAEYFTATNGKGVVIFFDFGDDNLSALEAEWGLRAVLANRSLFGIPAGTDSISTPFVNGADATPGDPYDNVGTNFYTGCEPYFHHAHKAAQTALYTKDFAVPGYQYGATCDTDPDQVTSNSVSLSLHHNDAVGTSTIPFSATSTWRYGQYDKYYGWLYEEFIERKRVNLSFYPEGSIFSNVQYFWRRY